MNENQEPEAARGGGGANMHAEARAYATTFRHVKNARGGKKPRNPCCAAIFATSSSSGAESNHQA